MRGIPKQYSHILDGHSVAILAKTFRDGCGERHAKHVLTKNHKLFSLMPPSLRDSVVSNIDTFILSTKRFNDIAYLESQVEDTEPLKVFLVWVIIQLDSEFTDRWCGY